jgi:hypothetical protein
MSAQHNVWHRVRIVGRLHGSTTNNVLHFREQTGSPLDDPALQAILTRLAAAVFACVLDTLIPAVTSDWTFVRVEAQTYAPTLSDAVVQEAQAGVVGELSPTSVSFASALVNLKTGGGGRRGRGKIFLPPPGEQEVQESLLNGPTHDLLEAFLQCLFAKFVGGTRTDPAEWCVFSRANAGALLGDVSTANRPVLQAIPSSVIARCGSRKLGKGA